MPASTGSIPSVRSSGSKLQSNALHRLQHYSFRQHAVKFLLLEKISTYLYHFHHGPRTLGVCIAIPHGLDRFGLFDRSATRHQNRQALASLHFDATLFEIQRFPLVLLSSLSRSSNTLTHSHRPVLCKIPERKFLNSACAITALG